MTTRPKIVVTYGPSLAEFVILTGAQVDALIVILAYNALENIDVPVTSHATKLIPGQANARAVTALTRKGMATTYDAADGTPMVTATEKAFYGILAHMPTIEMAIRRARERIAAKQNNEIT